MSVQIRHVIIFSQACSCLPQQQASEAELWQGSGGCQRVSALCSVSVRGDGTHRSIHVWVAAARQQQSFICESLLTPVFPQPQQHQPGLQGRIRKCQQEMQCIQWSYCVLVNSWLGHCQLKYFCTQTEKEWGWGWRWEGGDRKCTHEWNPTCLQSQGILRCIPSWLNWLCWGTFFKTDSRTKIILQWGKMTA